MLKVEDREINKRLYSKKVKIYVDSKIRLTLSTTLWLILYHTYYWQACLPNMQIQFESS